MSQHPLNLGLRLLLELGALWLLGLWGWSHEPLPLRLALAIFTPGVAAGAWGVFRVPDDGGTPVVPVPGVVRMALEAAVMGGSAATALVAGHPALGTAFGALVVLHYGLSWDRAARLLRG